MRFILNFIFICLAVLMTAGFADTQLAQSSPDNAALIARMQAGGHILMIRHANAPGNGDPQNFKIGDCSTQRNLDTSGRTQATEIGKWLRNHGVTSAKVYSSQWCRCLDTASLLETGSVKEMPALNSFYELTQNREPSLKALHKFIAEQPIDGKLIILVTHFATISALTNTAVSSGDGVLLQLNEGGGFKVVAEIENMEL